MSLTLYYHPLASFCWKALIPLYENGTPFKPHLVDLGDAEAAAAFKAIWPIRKFPVLRDDAKNRTVAELTTIIEYLAQHYPGRTALVPSDADQAREVRFTDRLYDLYVHLPMQKIMTDRLRPAGKNDPHGVEEAKATLLTALGIIEKDMAARTWATGETFTMADCAACAGAVLRQHGGSVHGHAQERGGVFGPAEAASGLCARAEGGRAVLQVRAEIGGNKGAGEDVGEEPS